MIGDKIVGPKHYGYFGKHVLKTLRTFENLGNIPTQLNTLANRSPKLPFVTRP